MKRRIFCIFLTALLPGACGRFYPSFTEHGFPQNDTIRDTVTISADSLSVHLVYPHNDTLWFAHDTLNPGSAAILRWTQQVSASQDSLALYGIIRARDTLILSLSHPQILYENLLPVKIRKSPAQGFLDHEFTYPLNNAQAWELRLRNKKKHDSALYLNTLILIGSIATSGNAGIVRSAALAEEYIASEYYRLSVPGNLFFWDSVPVRPGDSLIGSLDGSSIALHLFNSAQMLQFTWEGPPGNPLWRGFEKDSLRLAVTTPDMIYLVYQNTGDSARYLNAQIIRRRPIPRFRAPS